MLYIFTALFPYGKGTEVFLEDEIVYFSKVFKEITLVPFSGNIYGVIRQVPSNCIVMPPIISNRKKQYLKALLGFRNIKPYLSELFSMGVLFNKERLHSWLVSYIHVNCVFQSNQWKTISKNRNNSDVLYFYWGRNENAITAFVGKKIKCVSRFHGEWDLWEESSGGYIPLRKKVSEQLKLAVFISQKGEQYFKNRYPNAKTLVSRLGSKDNGITRKSNDGILHVLSCSSVYALKRVPLIYDSLMELKGYKIEWTHLGDGEDMKMLKNHVEQNKTSQIEVTFKGWVSHNDVMNYYKNNCVDLFINLSTNEGIPVSIMEAISFNVPIVATNVGGTSEIVNEQTGVLVSPNPSPAEVSEAIQEVLNKKYISPRSFWEEMFNADTNYSRYANVLKLLSMQ